MARSTKSPVSQVAPVANVDAAALQAQLADLQNQLALLTGIAQAQQEQIATMQANKPTGSNGPRSTAGWKGFSSTAIVRYLGFAGYSNKQVFTAMHVLGSPVAFATVTTQRQAARQGRGSIPTLTEEQKAELAAIMANLPKLQIGIAPAGE